MKINLLLATVFISLSCMAQKPRITWGDEFKLHRGSTDLEVIHADNTGVYLQEGHLALKSYFVIGATLRTSATLIKLDKNLGEIYRNDFNKELKGKEFVQFFNVREKLYVFASDYAKREKTLSIYGAEINRSSGQLSGDWTFITSFQKDGKRDEINFKFSHNADSTMMIVVSTIEGRDRNEYKIQEFDQSLKATTKPVIISNEFDPKTFQLEDVLYTVSKRIVLVGRVYEFREGKKKKAKFLDFSNYNIRMYDERGKKVNEVNTNINGRWLASTKLVQEKNKDIVLAAFYNNEKRGKTIDGMLVQRLHPLTGEVINTSEKQISHSLLSTQAEQTDDEDSGESRQERKERERLDKIKDEGEAFSKYMRFRNIFYTADNGLVVLAEKYHHYTYMTQSHTGGSNGSAGTWTTTYYSVYECGDLLMCKINEGGDISWLQVQPKSQREVIQTGSSGGFVFSGYFDAGNRPFYAGFGALQTGDAIQVLFNDNPKNAVVTQPGQKVKDTRRFGKSDCFILTVNLSTGKTERKMFFSNSSTPTAMPRLGSVIGDGMFIVGKEDRLLGRSKIAVAKISMK